MMACLRNQNQSVIIPGAMKDKRWFHYKDGNYYVVIENVSLPKDLANSGPGVYLTVSNSVQRITDRIVEFNDYHGQIDTFYRGDICKYGSDYYVFNSNAQQYVNEQNITNSGYWYKLP